MEKYIQGEKMIEYHIYLKRRNVEDKCIYLLINV